LGACATVNDIVGEWGRRTLARAVCVASEWNFISDKPHVAEAGISDIVAVVEGGDEAATCIHVRMGV
jgi:hypothetical protein